MEDPIKKGATVRQVVPVIEGVVQDVTFDAESMSFKYRVTYVGADGESHERWFTHAELVDVSPATSTGA